MLKTDKKQTEAAEATASDREISEHLQLQIDRHQLDRAYRIGTNDLLQIWRGGHHDGLDSLISSLEHLAWYLRSEDAEGIKSPKAWLLKQLRRGYYPAPVGFSSWDEQQRERKLADSQAKRERLLALQRQQFEEEFTLWLLELSPEAQREHLRGTMCADSPKSPAAKPLLRQAFAALQGKPDPAAENT